jgi:hypothetical protein
MTEERLEGGYAGGAVRAGDTVRRLAGPWTPAVHALLTHLADKGFTDFAVRPRRLGQFLRACGWSGTAGDFPDVVEARITAHADLIRGNAASGDEAFGRLLAQGVPDGAVVASGPGAWRSPAVGDGLPSDLTMPHGPDRVTLGT